MLHTISWQQLVLFFLSALVLWYAIVGISYYRNELKGLLKIYHNRGPLNPNVGVQTKQRTPADVFALAQQLRDDLALIFQQAEKCSYPKQELIMALQLCLRGYQVLKHSAFQMAINQFIAQTGDELCRISFNEGELAILWLD